MVNIKNISPQKVTISTCVLYDSLGKINMLNLLEKVDRALYRTKENGRNRVEFI